MTLNRFWLVVVLILSVKMFSFAQESRIAKGLKEFEAKHYDVSSKIYAKLIKKDTLDPQLYPDVYRNGAISSINIQKYTNLPIVLSIQGNNNGYIRKYTSSLNLNDFN